MLKQNTDPYLALTAYSAICNTSRPFSLCPGYALQKPIAPNSNSTYTVTLYIVVSTTYTKRYPNMKLLFRSNHTQELNMKMTQDSTDPGEYKSLFTVKHVT